MNYYSRNNNNKQNSNSAAQKQKQAAPATASSPAAANFPSQQATANFPSQQATANFPSQQATANFPSQQATANFPSQQATANFPSQQATPATPKPPIAPPPPVPTTRPTTGQRPVGQRPFTPPAGQIQIEHSKGSLQTVETTPSSVNGAITSTDSCTECSPENVGSAISSVLSGLNPADIVERIAEVITVPAAVSGGTTDAVTLPAAVWQIPSNGNSNITTLPANVADLPTTGAVTLPAPKPDYKACLGNFPLAMCYVPMQKWETPYSENIGFEAGTIFPSLNLKFDAEKGCAVK
jgi:hypothetical protein